MAPSPPQLVNRKSEPYRGLCLYERHDSLVPSTVEVMASVPKRKRRDTRRRKRRRPHAPGSSGQQIAAARVRVMQAAICLPNFYIPPLGLPVHHLDFVSPFARIPESRVAPFPLNPPHPALHSV